MSTFSRPPSVSLRCFFVSHTEPLPLLVFHFSAPPITPLRRSFHAFGLQQAVRIRPALLTTTDPLLTNFLSPLLEGTRVSTVAASLDKVVNVDLDDKTKDSPLMAVMDGVFADFNM